MDSWDEKVYVWTKGDSFGSVSQRFYKTEDYAAALQMYNRSHPRASSALRRDGTVAEGDKIYIPEDSRILEKRHADAIVKPSRSRNRPVRAPPPSARCRRGFRTLPNCRPRRPSARRLPLEF